MKNLLAGIVAPAVLAIAGLVILVLWASAGPSNVEARIDGMDKVVAPVPVQSGLSGAAATKPQPRPVPGEPVRGEGSPSRVAGSWPWFRGRNYDAIAHETVPLARKWPAGGPKKLWTVELGEGFAAAAVSEGRVYVLDHIPDADMMRCFSLDDGKEIWRNGYPVVVPLHHGRSRTVPAVLGKYVISLGPMCHVVCWDADTGKALWLIDLVADHGATVPEWYAGQCPLIDAATDRLVLAPGGKDLLIAVDYKTGEVVWTSGNPRGWKMTHSSVVPMEFGGRRMYVYCGSGGVAGVSADDGAILWDTTDWRIATATCPSPVPLGDGRIFLCGGYSTGSLMLQLQENGGRLAAKTLFRRTAKQFGSEQQTPVLLDGHLYGVRQHDKKLVCLDLDGNEVWNSARDKFGSAPYMIAEGLLYALNDDGLLTMAEAAPSGYKVLGKTQAIEDGVTAWGPMALVAGRLIVRDMTRMVCLDVSQK